MTIAPETGSYDYGASVDPVAPNRSAAFVKELNWPVGPWYEATFFGTREVQ